MDLCLVMIGRFEEKNGSYFTDKKNINAFKRYLKYFDKINIVARRATEIGLYPREKIELIDGKITVNLYEEEKGFSKIIGNRSFLNVLDKVINKSDIVLCWSEPKTNLIVEFAHRNTKRIIVYVGGCNKDILLSSGKISEKIAAYIVYYSNKKGIYNSDYVHYVTAKELQKRYPTKAKNIGASYVDVDLNIEDSIINNRVDRYDDENRIINIGLIGYLNYVKGIDTAIEALSILNNDKIKLNIVGGGNNSEFLKIAKKVGVETQVKFIGSLRPGNEVLEWLDNIDLYIQPSRTEGLPRATIEAMSRGCPIISSNAMGLKELIDEKYTHNPGDSKKMAELIKSLLEDKNSLKRQSSLNLEKAKNYDRAQLDKKIDDFFHEIINEVSEINE